MGQMVARGCARSGVRHPDIDPNTGRGRAFAIDEALLALRWADLVRERGYRLTISQGSAEADEVLEIHVNTCARPISRLRWGRLVIWSTDIIGHARPFATLYGALLAIAPLSARDRRTMLRAQRPTWFDLLPWDGIPAGHPGAKAGMQWLARIMRKLRTTSRT